MKRSTGWSRAWIRSGLECKFEISLNLCKQNQMKSNRFERLSAPSRTELKIRNLLENVRLKGDSISTPNGLSIKEGRKLFFNPKRFQ